MSLLKGKTALITGASSGIGKSFAYLLAKSGTHLILTARSEDKLRQITEDIRQQFGVNAHYYLSDLSKPDAAQQLYDVIKGDGYSPNLVINNAGFGKWGPLHEFSMNDYQDMIQLNVTSLTELAYLYLADFQQQGEGGLINVGSTASFLPVPFASVYAASKSYVLSFTEGLVGEYEGTGVKVSCLCPGGTDTNFANVANEEISVADVKMKTPDEVAQEGLDGFLAGKHYVLTGRKFQIQLMRFLSRKRVINMVATAWKKRLASK